MLIFAPKNYRAKNYANPPKNDNNDESKSFQSKNTKDDKTEMIFINNELNKDKNNINNSKNNILLYENDNNKKKNRKTK